METYRDKHGNLRIKENMPEIKLFSGNVIWRKTINTWGERIDVLATVLHDNGDWVRIKTEDGTHRVKRHNLRKV
jgi:hypothetical protein